MSAYAGVPGVVETREALGDTTPTLPPPEPKKNRWGILGQIIVLIVAIVVAYFTGVWLGEVIGGVAGFDVHNAVQQYNVDAQSWALKTGMPTARSGSSSARMP